MVRRDLKARYGESVLGFFWSLLRPAVLTAILYVVFTHIMPVRVPTTVPYWLHVLPSILLWQFILGSLTESTHSVVANAPLLKKVPLDAEVFPIAAIVAHLLHLCLALLLVILVMPLGGVAWRMEILLLPVALVPLVLFVLAITLFLSALQVHIRDTAGVLELTGMAWFYISPVIYPISTAVDQLRPRFGDNFALLYICNPVAPLLAGVRRTLIYTAGAELPDSQLLMAVGITTLSSAVLLFATWSFFRRHSPTFVDVL